MIKVMMMTRRMMISGVERDDGTEEDADDV